MSSSKSIEVDFDNSSTISSITDSAASQDPIEISGLVNIQADSSEDDQFDDFPSTISETKGPHPPTNLVLVLNEKADPASITFLIKKIKDAKRNGGAELLVRCEPFTESPQIVLHLTATSLRFIEAADVMGFKKVDDRGLLTEFRVHNLDSFLHDDIVLENVLTPAEKTLVVLSELQGLKALPGEAHVPGYPNMKLHSGQSILHEYIRHSLITSHYPLHDEHQLKLLIKSNLFSAFFSSEPFEQIRWYFGDTIALYFTFSGFYTFCLTIPSLISFLLALLPETFLNTNTEICLLSLMNLIFVTFLLKLWRRKCSELSYGWGTLKMMVWESPRLGYGGRMGVDPITGEYQARYPAYKTRMKVWLVSFPIVLLSICLSYTMMLSYFRSDEALAPLKAEYKGSLQGYVYNVAASAGYSLTVAALTHVYRGVANGLTEWENHRTQTQHEKHRVAKLVAFESTNNFVGLFYVAFIRRDLVLLRRQLIVMLFVMHLVNAIQEIVLPLVLRRTGQKLKQFLFRSKRPSYFEQVLQSAVKSQTSSKRPQAPAASYIWPRPAPTTPSSYARFGLEPLEPDDERIEMRRFEEGMDPYKGSYDDYLPLFIQFGYVFLFSPVFPLSVAVASLMNILHMGANLFKLCAVWQRPTPKRAKDIGTWQVAFEFIGFLAVMSNIALIVLSTGLKEAALQSGWSSEQFFFWLIFAEHGIIVMRLAVNHVVHNVPQWVRIATARADYKAKIAYRKEQSKASRKRLTLKFRAINRDLWDRR